MTDDHDIQPTEAQQQADPSLTIKGGSLKVEDPSLTLDRLPVESILKDGRLARIQDDGHFEPGPRTSDGRYEIELQLGVGGMGIVYSARQLCLNREVALKLHRMGAPGDSDTFAREATQFAQEALVTAGLEHPNVIPVYALARDPDGRLFFTMRKVEGITWAELLHPEQVADPERRAKIAERARKTSWREHLAVLLRVADAAAFAHSKGFLHRDLKPENVMLGEFGEVYVMDWGLALPYGERNPYRNGGQEKPELTGTPHYMAPEMARGEIASLAPQADIFMLGATLTEVMTGRPPDRGKTIVEIIGTAARGEYVCPVPPADAPRIHPTLSRILGRALAAKAEDRYSDVREFQTDLRAYIRHADSIEVSSRAAGEIEKIEAEIEDGPGDPTAATRLYGRVGEILGRCRQALEIWNANGDARVALLRAQTCLVRLATSVGDVALARSQFRLLDRVPGPGAPEGLEDRVAELKAELDREITEREEVQARTARQAKLLRSAAIAIVLLLLAGVGVVLGFLENQRSLAVAAERNLFVSAVEARANSVEQFLAGTERLVGQYCQEAERLLSLPPDELPTRPLTPAGRDGYYLDEDYNSPGTRPSDMRFSPLLASDVSPTAATVALAPWARVGEARETALRDARVLSRLDTRFAQVHTTREDLVWSVVGTESGVLVAFPGMGRYRDKPEYDPTTRPWYTAAMNRGGELPAWGAPYPDEASKKIVVSCVCPFQHAGEPYGVIGLQVSTTYLRELLLDFSRAFQGRTRCLLVRPFKERDPETGETIEKYRVIVDTATEPIVLDWRAPLELPLVTGINPCVTRYHEMILDGTAKPGRCELVDDLLLAHAPVGGRGWTLIAYSLRE